MNKNVIRVSILQRLSLVSIDIDFAPLMPLSSLIEGESSFENVTLGYKNLYYTHICFLT